MVALSQTHERVRANFALIIVLLVRLAVGSFDL
jgi:hypothetical protein